MANESLGATPEDLRKARNRMIKYGGASLAALAAFIYFFFFGFVPAAKQYTEIKEKLCISIAHADGSQEDRGCHEQKLNQQQAAAIGGLLAPRLASQRLSAPGAQNVIAQLGRSSVSARGPPLASLFALPSAHAVVTTVGKGFLVDAWQNIVEMEIMKYHGVGTGTNAAAAGDTALQTEITTQINPDSTRATGSLTEGASGNIFRTVGTVSFDGSAAVTEWGLFSQAATGGGTMFSRIVFSAINVANGDSIQFTYDLTVS